MIALAGLLLSGVVHVASMRGIDVESAWPKVWVLHYALFPIVVLAVLTAVVAAQQKRLGLRSFLGIIPWPALLVLAAAFLYVLVTFFRFVPLSGAGAPVIQNGRFFFNDHGVVSEVSEDQFHVQRSLSLRLYSSVWIYLYLFSAVYLLAARQPPDGPILPPGAFWGFESHWCLKFAPKTGLETGEPILDSACARPKHAWHYSEDDWAVLAVSLMLGIARNHPFDQGNKRTGFAASAIFLNLNGLDLKTIDSEGFAEIIIAAVERRITDAIGFIRHDLVEFVDWLIRSRLAQPPRKKWCFAYQKAAVKAVRSGVF
jgi:prophage maintenance system killer protein